jgi:RimJ/RimL family protein N-acetyltransferase
MTLERARRVADGDFSTLGPIGNLEAAAGTLRDVAGAYVSLYAATQAVAPWIGYLAKPDGQTHVVGTCGFKDKFAQGPVEIAYFTFPGWEGKGFATAMATGLIDIARRTEPARPVFAHTLDLEGASTRILRKLGFACQGAVQDPEDGKVWRWQM